ncbi:MAG: hypothetical protein H6719_32020 [Sandaracinaceae bacterium]|nr:hypothetical protein [Sandaracinaceae bacterium]
MGDRVRRALTLGLALGGAVACFGCDEAAEEVEEPEAVEPEETVVPDEEAAPSYTIHEWGLIDVDLGERRVEFAAGPGRAEAPSHAAAAGGGDDGDEDGDGTGTRPRLPTTGREVVDRTVDTATGVLDALTGRNAPRRKPVLYFHLDAPSPGFRFDLTVSLGATARIVEHFPAATLADHQVTWSQVELASESCAGGPYPTAESPVCEGVADGYCEAAELGTYVSDDAGCLTFGGGQQNFLFYRGDGPAPDLPLTITRNADGTVTVTNTSMGAPVGELLRLRRHDGAIQVAQVAIPATGSVSVGLPATAAADAHRDTIRAQLRSIGLTDGEAAAFERAWFAELFDAEAATPHAFVDAVFFFLPASQVDGFAHLEATPAPSATARAMAVRAGWTTL